MQIVYGFIYYFVIFMTTCICLLSVFILPPMRILLVKFWRTYLHILEHDIVRYAKMVSFSLIGFVFIQSAYVLFVLESHFSRSKFYSMKELSVWLRELEDCKIST